MLFGFGKPPEPNLIDTVNVPGSVGCMGLVGCPGARISQQAQPLPRKYLLADLEELQNWGANGVVTLVEPHELKMLGVEELPQLLADAGIWWKHLPIIDMDIPNQAFEDTWAVEGERIRHALRIGERVAIHCYAGLGRAGMISARILVEMGLEPELAIRTVRSDNRRRIQTRAQANFVRSCHSLVGATQSWGS
ncbi:MAG: phosphatase [Granulosicoccaceae bacterium]